jgi:uncharacterized protein (TIGR00369 family)
VTTDHPSAIGVENGHAHCLLCGSCNAWSWGLRFSGAGDGAVHAAFQAHPRLQGYEGVLHGGVVASLLDAGMTHCLFHLGVQAVTGDLHIRFVEPVPCQALLDIRAQVLSATPPLYRLRAELLHEERVLAWAEGRFMQRGGARRCPSAPD